MVGSPMWMPPEMIYHVPQTVKADVWSLGCTLFQLIAKEDFALGGKLRVCVQIFQLSHHYEFINHLVDYFHCCL